MPQVKIGAQAGDPTGSQTQEGTGDFVVQCGRDVSQFANNMTEMFRCSHDNKITSVHHEPQTDSTFDLGTNTVRWRNVYADTLYGDGSNLSNVISGVDLKFEGASVGTGVTMLNFVGFNTVTAPVSGLSTITSGQNLTIGVRSGSAVEASLTGTSFNVIARSGGNISINI